MALPRLTVAGRDALSGTMYLYEERNHPLMKPTPKTQSAGGIVMNPQGQVLLVQEYGKYWGLPRGHVEPGESLQQTAVREIAEEAGITSLQYIAEAGAYERSTFDEDGSDNFREMKRMTFFMFYTDQIELKPQDQNITNARWVYPETAASYFIHPKDRKFYLQSLPLIQKWILGR